MANFWVATRGVLVTTRRQLADRDLMLASAGATLYGSLAAIPSLLVAVSLAGFILGQAKLERYGRLLADTVPTALGAGNWVLALFGAGLSLSPLAVIFAGFMASAYGRGLRRALRRFAPVRQLPAQERELPPSWWSRATTLPLLGAAPLLLLILLLGTPAVSQLEKHHGLLGVAGASFVGLVLVWVITWVPLTWAFRVVAPGRPAWRAALIGAVVTGSFISGFLQGFTLFLALPVDLGRPFGGLAVVGATTALLLWLWVLHIVVCIGYTFTWAVDAALAPARP